MLIRHRVGTSYPSPTPSSRLPLAANFAVTGPQRLNGSISVRGSKKAVPKLMLAALLTAEPCCIQNVPESTEVRATAELLRALGATVEVGGGRATVKGGSTAWNVDALASVTPLSRIPILACGPLLARTGTCPVPRLGGCDLGPRPVDLHLAALQAFGAQVDESKDGRILRGSKMRPAEITLPHASVGATEQILLTASALRGPSVLRNAAHDPEIEELVGVLRLMGVEIHHQQPSILKISGGAALGGFHHTAASDRFEIASWACAAAATDGRVTVRLEAPLRGVRTFTKAFRRLGGGWHGNEHRVELWRDRDQLSALALATGMHPRFESDWGAPFLVPLVLARGRSSVHEGVFERRFGCSRELARMGARINVLSSCPSRRTCSYAARGAPHLAIIEGPCILRGARVSAPDVRGGFALLIAALAAEGESVVERFHLLDRAYPDLGEKLGSLGVVARRPEASNAPPA